MPVFHTKTIESILEPVAQQVSRLIVLHQECEDGNPMPSLQRPVQAVSAAVKNLVRVGRETIASSDDEILKQDMPISLIRVEEAAKFLELASEMLSNDAYSQPAREKLIEGSRGILQGTSSLLGIFDESEVRKIIRECKRVLDYLAVTEVVDTLEDLVRFVKDLSPCLSKVSREVDSRQKELTHQAHRESLIKCLDEVKTLTPILICSMKIFIQIHSQRGKGDGEAAENRDYLSQRMIDEINEIIRVLQLTTYDEDAWGTDNLTAMKRGLNIIDSKIQNSHDWLGDTRGIKGGVGEKSVRGILDEAIKLSERCLPPMDRDIIRKMCGDIESMTDGLCELRENGQGHMPSSESLAKGIENKINELNSIILKSVSNVERSGIVQPAHSVQGRLEQARRWLQNPTSNDRGLGERAILLIIDEARRVADGLPGVQKSELLNLSDENDSLLHTLSNACRRGEGNSSNAQMISGKLINKLSELKNNIQNSVINQFVVDFVDTLTPLRQFIEAIMIPEGSYAREQNFNEKAVNLQEFSYRAAKTARLTVTGCGDNKKLADVILLSSSQIETLTPQLINAGRIRMAYPDNQAAGEHFDNLKAQYSDTLARVRYYCDVAIDSGHFIQQSENAIKKHAILCDEAIRSANPSKMVDNTSSIARLANRVLMVARQEVDNSEDSKFNRGVSIAADLLQGIVPIMVKSAKSVALNIRDHPFATKWRDINNELIHAVGNVKKSVEPYEYLPEVPPPPIDNMNNLYLNEMSPRRPPPPEGTNNFGAPPRPPPPETDDEDDLFVQTPLPNQPIMIAAHSLHQEIKQWSSKDNEIVSAAKRMALLMAKLSQLVRGEGGTKKDLIACAKAIAEASEEVTRLAKELATGLYDKRMRTNLLQICERIPTIGTQLKILSTVKATMLGSQEERRFDAEIRGADEDKEATEMLVENAQNLMGSVKETVRAAEAASIKIRTDAGLRMRWVRRSPWYKY